MAEQSRVTPADPKLSRAAAHRLSQYLRSLGTGARATDTISSVELSAAVGVSAAQVRRDLAALGHLGQRGVGYDAVGLRSAIKKKLGIDRRWQAVLVGVGNLARALLRHRGFAEQGFDIVGLFDTDESKIGRVVDGVSIEPVANLRESVARQRAELGVLTLPSESAQSVADLLVQAGIKGILNFAPVMLKLPTGVKQVSVDLAIQFEQLAFAVADPGGRTTE